MNEEHPPEQGGEAPEAPAREAAAGLWRAPIVRVLPRYVALLALLAACALGWLVTESLLPQAQPAALEVAAGTDNPDDGVPAEVTGQEVAVSESTFSSRKLFIPLVPVESKETSWAVVEEMKDQLRLSAIFGLEDDRYAMVEVYERAPSRGGPGGRPGYTGRSASSSPSKVEKVKKGDHLLDFTVEQVKEDSVELSVAGFNVTLSF